MQRVRHAQVRNVRETAQHKVFHQLARRLVQIFPFQPSCAFVEGGEGRGGKAGTKEVRGAQLEAAQEH